MALLAVAGLLAACSASGPSASSSTTTEPGAADAVSGGVTVLAASSLVSVLTEVADQFERAHPAARVALGFDGSARLATQILSGAPADVFVSADAASLARVSDAGAVAGDSVVVATNALEIVVAAGNPLGIDRLEDLGGDLVVALCRVEEPCGAYAQEAFRIAGVPAPAAGREDNVRAVLTKVQLGEADAGLVYRTDVRGARGVSGVEIPEDQQVRATYRAAVLADAGNRRAAAAFIEYLQSRAASVILTSAGFGVP